MLQRIKNIGPGMLVAAAFIGPGTITTASMAGAQFGYSLLWCVAFSTLATIILQLMTVRIGIIARMGVGEALRAKTAHSKPLFYFVTFLVIVAILIGNSAYEAGNITGAVLGFTDYINTQFLIIIIALGGALLLYTGNFKVIENVLIGLVSLMGIIFLFAAISLSPDYSTILKSFTMPSVPDDAELLVIGLIGTTIVPYNLFLHATSVKKKWSQDSHGSAKIDAIISIGLGGIITMAVVISAASAFQESPQKISSMNDLSYQLEPILGSWAGGFMSIGFLGAGLSSTITAPLAAAYAFSEIRGKKVNLQSNSFKLIWLIVIVSGTVIASIDYEPTLIILFAQIANGLILPITVGFLLWTTNDRQLMKGRTNTWLENIVGSIILLLTMGLGAKGILSAFGII